MLLAPDHCSQYVGGIEGIVSEYLDDYVMGAESADVWMFRLRSLYLGQVPY